MTTSSILGRVLGTGSFLTLRGKKYQCGRVRVKHFAEAKAFLMSLAPDPLKELRETDENAKLFDSFPPEVQKALALKAFEIREERKALTSQEAAHWINGPEGVLFFFWVMVRDFHPELATIQAVFEAFPPHVDEQEATRTGQPQELSLPECELIKRKVDEMSGMDKIEEQAAKKDEPAKSRRARNKAQRLAKKKGRSRSRN